MTLRRLVVVFSALVALPVLGTAKAGAIDDLGWWFKASGVAHCTADANHLVCDGYDQYGNYQGPLWDVWLDWYCQLSSVTGGDNPAGTPFRVRLQSPAGSGLGCLPNNGGDPTYWSTYYGWHTGTGYSSGSNIYNTWYTAESPIYVFPRDAATVESRGTLVEIY